MAESAHKSFENSPDNFLVYSLENSDLVVLLLVFSQGLRLSLDHRSKITDKFIKFNDL